VVFLSFFFPDPNNGLGPVLKQLTHACSTLRNFDSPVGGKQAKFEVVSEKRSDRQVADKPCIREAIEAR